MARWAAVKQLRRRINRGHPADCGAIDVVQVLDQPEIGELDAVAHQEKVFRLDVEVLQGMLLVDVIEGVGGVVQVGQQLIAGNSHESRLAAPLEFLFQVRGSQLHDDYEVALNQFDPLKREQEGVANLLDAVQGGQFPCRAGIVAAAVDDLDGLA